MIFHYLVVLVGVLRYGIHINITVYIFLSHFCCVPERYDPPLSDLLHKAALRLLREAIRNGTWLCLKNLHLVVGWLPTLEKELSSLEPHK